MVPRGFTRDHFSLSEPVPGREKVFYSAFISVILFRGGLGVKIDRFAKKGFLKKIQGIFGLVVALVVFVTLYWMVICLVMKDPLTPEGIRDTILIELADMVESRDENTGDHVRKTAAYTRIIMDRLKALGYYTDQLKADIDAETTGKLRRSDL